MRLRAGCEYPKQPTASDAEREHPRFLEYTRYRNALDAQLVTAISFRLWLSETEKEENGHSVVYQVTSTEALLTPGWYKNVFPPKRARKGRLITYGPFATKQEAEQA